MIAFDDIEHLFQVEAWEHVDLKTGAQGERDVHADAARVGGGKDPWEGGLEAFGFEFFVEGEEMDFPLTDLGDNIAMC